MIKFPTSNFLLLLFVFAIILSVSSQTKSFCACRITITSAFMCDENGDQITPQVGDPFYVMINWSVAGTPAAAYSVKFTEANLTQTVPGMPKANGTYNSYWGYYLPLDGPIPVTVTIDPAIVTGAPAAGRTASLTFTPVPPKTPLEYFDTVTYSGEQQSTVQLNTSSDTLNGFTWLGEPTSDSYQQVISQSSPKGSQMVYTRPTNDPILQTPFPAFKAVTGKQTWVSSNTYNVALSETRVSPALLRQTSWTSFSALPSPIALWLTPTSVIQSNDTQITQFVISSLPSNYRSMLTPYDAAKTLFLAIVARTAYVMPPNSDGTALGNLVSKQAECNGFAALFAASLQNIGIPARVISGFWSGTNLTHVITEFYLPNIGWIQADPCMDRSTYDPSGTYAYDFGSNLQTNTLCVVSRSASDQASNVTSNDVQVGRFWYWYIGGFTPNSTATVNCSLNPITLPACFSLYTTPPILSTLEGTQIQDVVLVNPSNNFDGNVNFSVSGAPSGVVTSLSSAASTTGTTLKVTVGTNAAPGNYDVTVTGKSGVQVTTQTVPLYVTELAPKITGFTPTSALIGTKVTITGSYLFGASIVTFAGGVTAVPTGVTATSATAVIPKGAVTGAFKITTPGRTATSLTPLRVI